MTDKRASNTELLGPVFIVGMNGSGTTMLLDHLNNHSAIHGFVSETRVLPYFMARSKAPGSLDADDSFEKLWDDMRSAFPIWKANQRQAVPLPADWRDRERSAAAVFDYLMHYFAEREGKRIWCEKTPMHALHIQKLSAAFPGSRFIQCIRDGRDCAASFNRRYGYDAKCTLHRWKKTIREARNQADSISERYYEVKYEDITAEPENVMQHVCEFLQLPFEQETLESSRKGPRVDSIKSDTIVPNSGKYRSYFDTKQIIQMEKIGGALLYQLGYETGNPSGDADVSPFYLWSRQNYARLRLAIKEIPHRLSLGVRKPWKTIFGRFVSSWRQSRSNKL